MKQKKEMDPEGLPLSRQMAQQHDDERRPEQESASSIGKYETSSTPLPAPRNAGGYSVGQETASTPAAPEMSAPTCSSGGPRAPEVSGESSFGMNARPERGDAVAEYRQPASRLPDAISAREIADDAASYVDGRCGNVSTGAR